MKDIQIKNTSKRVLPVRMPDVKSSYKKAAPMPDVPSSNTKTRRNWRLSDGGAMKA